MDVFLLVHSGIGHSCSCVLGRGDGGGGWVVSSVVQTHLAMYLFVTAKPGVDAVGSNITANRVPGAPAVLFVNVEDSRCESFTVSRSTSSTEFAGRRLR